MKSNTVWMIVFLVGAYILAQAVADIGATKMVDLGGIVLPAGSLMFALTFTLRDLVHKRLGKAWAVACIVAAAAFNIVQALYLAWMGRIPAPPFFAQAEAWAIIFALVPSITIASITAECISELIDTQVYHLWTNYKPDAPQWTRVIISNAISLPIDSFIFGTLAFAILPRIFGGDILSFRAAMSLVVGQIIWKAVVTVVSMPTIYLVKEKPLEVSFA